MDFIGFIDTVFDAFVLVEAARSGQVKMMVSRPVISHRINIEDGTTIIYDETETRIKRWTDGRSWTPSKLYGGFFLYEERVDLKNEQLCAQFQNLDNGQEIKWKLMKKVITVVTPDNHVNHVINYFYYPNIKGPFIKPNLIRPIHYKFNNMNTIINNAKECQYYKCFRSKSDKWKKLYYAPEVEAEKGLTSGNKTRACLSDSSLKNIDYKGEIIEQQALSNEFYDDRSYPAPFKHIASSESYYSTATTIKSLYRHPESTRMINELNRFAF